MNYIDLGEGTRIYKKESVFNGCNQTSLAFPKFKRIPIKKITCGTLIFQNLKKCFFKMSQEKSQEKSQEMSQDFYNIFY